MSTNALIALNEPVFEADLGGHVVFATESLLELFGLEALGLNAPVAEHFSDATRPAFEHAFHKIAEGKAHAASVDVTLGNDPGSQYEIKLAALVGANEKPIGVAGSLSDVTDARITERQASLNAAHLLNLTENTGEPCLVESATGEVESVNSAFCLLFGILDAPQSLVGLRVADVLARARKESGSEAGPRPPAKGGTLEFEFRLPDGRGVRQRVFLVEEDDTLQGRLYLYDVSAAPPTKTGKGAKQDKADSATTAAQVALVERIARELATTVESAGSAIHRAEQLDLPGTVLEHFQRVESSARNAFNAIGGLLDFSKFEPTELKTVKLEQTEFNLREVLGALVEHVAVVAEERNVQLRLRVEQDIPAYLTGDAPRLILVLRSVIEALIGALDTAGGAQHELHLTVSPEYVEEQSIHLNFSVDANSAGKPSKLRAFAPLALMQLAVARQLVNVMGGSLDNVQRKDAVGYGFAAAFPWRESFEHRPRLHVVTLTSMPVLIVSADPAQRSELSALLKSWRMQPKEADNATMAMQLLLRQEQEGEAIPLVILPNQMPVQDGFLLAFRIKHHPKLAGTQIMMLAQGGMPGDAITCRENGISAYLRYPLSANQLNQAIAAVTGVSKDESDATHTLITRHSLHESRDGSILVVDSNREVQLAAAHILKKRGYTLTEADSAEAAFKALEQDIFDAVMVDPDLPGFVDVVLDIRARAQKRPQDLVVIAMSANGSEQHRQQCEKAGYNGFVGKPLDKDSLITFLAAKLPPRELAAE
ncbi:MAG: response regulator [Betaproteobacteria bacterium]|nr:response regulator [Betaproteobacteria bacterium]